MAESMKDILLNFKEWTDEQNILLHPGLDIKYDKTKGLHVCARQSFDQSQREENWISVSPHAASLSILNAIAQDNTHFPLRSNVGSILSQKISEEATAYFLLVEQYLLGDKSFWAPYIKSLPQPESLSTPLYFPDDDRRWLEGTNMLKATQVRESKWKEELDDGIKALDESGADSHGYTWERFVWAGTIFTSRSFGFPSATGKAIPVLYPLTDALNHDPTAKVSWNFNHDKLSIISHENIEPGQEVNNNYGPKGNEELFLGYGFCLPGNPWDAVAVELSHPGSAAYAYMRAKDPENFPSSEWKTLRIDLRPTDEDLSSNNVGPGFLTLLSGKALSAFRAIIEFKIWGETFLHHKSESTQDHDCRLLIATLENVVRLLDGKKETILRLDEGLGEPKNANQQNAKIYRDGQSRILSICAKTLLEGLHILRPRGDFLATSQSGLFTLNEALAAWQHASPDIYRAFKIGVENAVPDWDPEAPSEFEEFIWVLFLAGIMIESESESDSNRVVAKPISVWTRTLKAAFSMEYFGRESDHDTKEALEDLAPAIEELAKEFPGTISSWSSWYKHALWAYRVFIATNIILPGSGITMMYMHADEENHPWRRVWEN